jgi:hypothetical protein
MVDGDTDRWYSRAELKRLSDRDLTKLAFIRNLRNIIFFTLLGTGLTYFFEYPFVYWIVLIGYIALTVEPLIGGFLTLISIVGPQVGYGPSRLWKLLQVLISLATIYTYSSFAFYTYTKLQH